MNQWFRLVCLAACLLGTHVVQASVVVGGTRVVYDATKKEAAISVRNTEKVIPYLIQSWIDNAREGDSNKIPFIITPPLFRLDAGQENVLRILRTKGNLPVDRESVFWLNVKSIPSSEKTTSNQLQIAINTRIKLFYRPENLTGRAHNAYKTLEFSRQGNQLQAKNPTPFYVSFYSLSVSGKEIKTASMIAPMSTMAWPLPNDASNSVSWQAINDYGGISEAASADL